MKYLFNLDGAEFEFETYSSLSLKAIAPLPSLAQYIARLEVYGAKTITLIGDKTQSYDYRLDATDYDAIRVFYQAIPLSSNVQWYVGINNAVDMYRDQYVVANKGGANGHYIFSRGLRLHYEATKDQKSADAIVSMSEHAAYAHVTGPIVDTVSATYARDVSFVLQCYIDRLSIDGVRRPNLDAYWLQAQDHLVQFLTKKVHVEPFMVAINCEGLIYGIEQGTFGSDRKKIVEFVEEAAAMLMKDFYDEAAQAFRYTDTPAIGPTTPAPDLSLMIVPIFGWLFKETGEEKYRTQGDIIFNAGVRDAYLDRGKQFNENYRWSPDYLKWTGR